MEKSSLDEKEESSKCQMDLSRRNLETESEGLEILPVLFSTSRSDNFNFEFRERN